MNYPTFRERSRTSVAPLPLSSPAAVTVSVKVDSLSADSHVSRESLDKTDVVLMHRYKDFKVRDFSVDAQAAAGTLGNLRTLSVSGDVDSSLDAAERFLSAADNYSDSVNS